LRRSINTGGLSSDSIVVRAMKSAPRFALRHLFLIVAMLLAPALPGWAAEPATASRPALSVSVVTPQQATLPLLITANGSVTAWQEASIGSESSGLRLAEVKVNVGDVVKRGQVLARFAADLVEADVAEAKAALAEAEARLVEARSTAQRSYELEKKGFLSPQKVVQDSTAEKAAEARVAAQKATLEARRVKLAQTQVRAPDDGVISARSATVGAVLPPGQELFRLIRQGRLEWRAEVAASELARLEAGQPATLTLAGGGTVAGTVRQVAPTVDPQTRNGIVYVDLPKPGSARAGMFARGEFQLGNSAALTLPQSAVVAREGFSYVYVVGADSKVTQTKVQVGRRVGELVEIAGGLDRAARVVVMGGAFLGDGDTVRVVTAPAQAPAAAK
jgi:RND family efflux transporter MFP subunit